MTPEVAHEWSKASMFYMNQREACFATALFVSVMSIERALPFRFVSGEARARLKRAFRDLDREAERIDALRAAMERQRQARRRAAGFRPADRA